MYSCKKSTVLSIAVCLFVVLVLVALIIVGPMLFRQFMVIYRGVPDNSPGLARLVKVFTCCFYPSAVVAGVILYALLRLLFNIYAGDVFIAANVKILSVVSWCCLAICGITLVGGFFYMPFFFVAAAGGFTGMLLRVLKNVMHNAVELRAENDLTI